MSAEVATIVVGVLIAFIGYGVKYVNDLRLAQRKDRLDRVNRQLSELYGPLFALNAAGTRLWTEFMRLPGRRSHVWLFEEADDKGKAWRLWMTTVFMPLNVEMRNAVVDHADLLRDTDMPTCLLDLFAHVAGYETVLERWRTGDFDPRDARDNTSVIDFPAEKLASYIDTAYFDLKREQSELMRGLGVARRRKHEVKNVR
jgi:hypothetical protein